MCNNDVWLRVSKTFSYRYKGAKRYSTEGSSRKIQQFRRRHRYEGNQTFYI